MQPIYSLVHHQFSKNKRAFALFLFLTLFSLILIAAYFDASPILFQSRESKNVTNGPVFNRISYVPGLEKDVWIMQQGHNGNDGAFTQWDRIGIVVVHDTVKSAEFFQLLPGNLSLDADAKMPKKAKCFSCHSNGPRAIRPDFAALQLKSWDRLRLFLWNLRIKSYGPVSSPKQQHQPDFRLQVDIANDTLDVKACTRCHNKNALFGRGELTRQNFPMIDFMLKEGLMPPPGFRLSLHEQNDVLKFIGR